ncbi:mechanosensitive ion channel family protein [Methanoplanus sp. FWC-SCC4]|uniref:Mechanosensitive ion channel family protein n=1 Tax=Methanochimaera problematica TaxID=2609417 RepID=A0AA97FDT2_9EURY|nr:mechanosensitive ion channel family protein [Methanoplanus sp. FWC-SCC4]WOF16384.1 mechanosensitive ion channel family protein [Methanoplanus sp. FWC-SCC4]
MLRDYIIPAILLLCSSFSWFIGVNYFINEFYQLSWTFLLFALIFIGYIIITKNFSPGFIKDERTRYSFNKGIMIVSFVVGLFVLFRIWVEDTESLIVSYGILAAGIAIAIQDVFRNFVGGIIIAAMSVYRVGDRVEIGGTFGDVMDIGLMSTTMMELSDWDSGEQPTGRISVMPNSFVISEVVYNYTKDHNFIWDEITIPLTYDSDWKEAISDFLNIVRSETGDISLSAEKEIERLGEKYYLPKKVTEPFVYVKITDNWIELRLRYVTDAKNRRIQYDRLNRILAEKIFSSDKYSIGSENMEISGKQEIYLLKKS